MYCGKLCFNRGREKTRMNELVIGRFANLRLGSVFVSFQPETTAVSISVFKKIVGFGKKKRKPVLKNQFSLLTKQKQYH